MPRAVTGLILLLGGGAGCLTAPPAGYEEPPRAVCELRDPRIAEVSGIVASRRNPGCYYVHNDSGGQPRVFLVDRRGRTRLEIRLRGARAVDYEDIALAPGSEPGTFDVCVADIGDNGARRSEVTIYRFPEVKLEGRSGTTLEVAPTAYTISYADGPANAEAFFVHPRTGDGYILTKRFDGHSLVYKVPAPWDREQKMTLARTMTLELPPAEVLARTVTAADIAPDGRRVVVRCYLDGWEWRRPAEAGDGDFERIFATDPARLSLAPEPQGEALCYAADRQALLTVSEGRSPTLYESAARADPAEPP